MLDMKFLRENVDSVKENMKKKFQEHKLELVDKVVEMDKVNRQLKQRGDDLRAKRNAMSKEIGGLMAKGLKDEANAVKAKVQAMADEMKEIEEKEAKMAAEIKEIMMKIPNMIDPSVPIGKTIQKMWNYKNMGNRSYRLLKFLIIRKLWNVSMELI